MIFVLFVAILLSVYCNGFLFDAITTPRSSSVSDLTGKHDFAVIEMILQEKQMREKYMLQLQQKILKNENRTTTLEAKVNQLNLNNETTVARNEFMTLKNLTELLITKYKSLEGNYNTLQQKFVMIQQNYASVDNENKQLRREWNYSKQETAQMRQELNDLKHLKAINELQEIKDLRNDSAILKLQLQTTNNRINSMVSIQQARGQDFLALYNQTLESSSKMKSIESELSQTTNQLKQEIQQERMRSEKELQQLATTQNTTIYQLKNAIASNSEKVGFTAFAKTSGTVSANAPMLFPSIITSYGITNLSTFKGSGVFNCENSGLYIVTLTVMTDTFALFFHIYKNSEYLVSVYVYNGSGSKNYHTGTAVVVVQLEINDKISVKPESSSYIYSYLSQKVTCLTIVKVK